jgi:hypothetical protein
MNADEREAYNDNFEKAIIFQTKLFGNIEFVGELYRRKILQESTLKTVFESLLGMSDINDEVDDLVIEGAVNLMNKVGFVLEENSKRKEERAKMVQEIFNRFDYLMELPDG